MARAGHRPRARTQVRAAEPSGLRPSRTRPRGNGRWRRRSRGFAGRRRAPPWGRVRPSWRWRPNAFELGMFSERCTYLQCQSALNLCYELCAQSQGRGRLPGLPGKAAGPGFRSEVPRSRDSATCIEMEWTPQGSHSGVGPVLSRKALGSWAPGGSPGPLSLLVLQHQRHQAVAAADRSPPSWGNEVQYVYLQITFTFLLLTRCSVVWSPGCS